MDTHMPGNVPCSEVRELLSDLIDVRRGELPHPDGTRLSEPGLRAAVELHVAACESCRFELVDLEETGFAFSEFTVNEPATQHFANYGAVVRARMAGKNSRIVQIQQPQRRSVLRPVAWFGVASAAAAGLAFVLSTAVFNPRLNERNETAAAKSPAPASPAPVAYAGNERLMPIADRQLQDKPVTLVVQDGNLTGRREVTYRPSEPAGLQNLTEAESKYGYLIFGERTAEDEKPLLGLLVRTTRDQDRAGDVDPIGLKVHNIVPGSPADAMGIQPGDYIVQVDNIGIDTGSAVAAAKFFGGVAQSKAGDPISIHVVRRDGKLYKYLKPKFGVLGRYEY